MKKKKQKKSKVPETTLQLLWVIIKGFFTNLPKMGLTLIIRSGVMFVAIMLFNIYMLAEVNNGFKVSVPQDSAAYGLLNVAGNKLAFNTLCFLVMFVITSLYTQIKQRGLKKFLLDLLTVPVWAYQCLRRSQHTFYAFFITFGLVSLIGLVYQNTYVFITLLISMFLGFTSKGGGMGTFSLNIIFSDFQRVFRYGKEKKKIDKETAGVLSLAAILSLVTLIFIPNQNMRIFSIVMPLVCILIVFLVSKKFMSKKAAAQLFVFMSFNLIYFTYTNTIFADDGGKPEVGGTWGAWAGSPGSGEVVKSGVQPGILGILGGYVSSALSSIWGGVKSAANAYNEAHQIFQDTVTGMAVQIGETAIHVIKRGGEEFIGVGVALGNAIKDLRENELLNDAFYDCLLEEYDGMVEDVTGLFGLRDQINSLIKDDELRDIFFDTVKNNLGEKWEAIKEMGGDTWQAMSEVFSDPQAIAEFLGGSIYDGAQFFTNPASLLEPYRPQIQNLLSNVWQGFSNGVNDPEKVYQFIKDMVGADNFANSWDENRGVWDRIGQALWGTFELGGAAHSVKELGQRGSQILGDIKNAHLDDDLIRSIDNMADEAGNLGQRGAYIQVDYVDPDFMPTKTKQALQELAEKYNVRIHIRPGNADSVSWLTNGSAIPKPVDLKMKTINYLDEMIGAPQNSRGLVGYFTPTWPPKGYDKLDDITKALVKKRYDKRLAELTDYGTDMAKYAQQGKYRVVDGLVYDVKTGKRVAGDVDLFSVTRPDGSALSRAEANQLEGIFANTRNSNVEHGSVVSWDPSDAKYNQVARDGMVNATYRGNEGLVTVNPDHTMTTTYVRSGTYRSPNTSSWWTRTFGANQIKEAIFGK